MDESDTITEETWIKWEKSL